MDTCALFETTTAYDGAAHTRDVETQSPASVTCGLLCGLLAHDTPTTRLALVTHGVVMSEECGSRAHAALKTLAPYQESRSRLRESRRHTWRPGIHLRGFKLIALVTHSDMWRHRTRPRVGERGPRPMISYYIIY